MVERQPMHVEAVQEFKRRMRMTAVRLSPALVTRAVRATPTELRGIIAAKGYNIKED